MTDRLDGAAAVPGGHIVFERIVIEGFRGFNAPIELDLDASVVLVLGPNGLGKTSLFDAIQWLLLGDVPRLRALRLRPSDEYLVNEYRRGDPAHVRARVRLGDRRVTLTRTGDRSGSALYWSSDDGVELRDEAAQRELAAAFSVAEDMALEDSLIAAGLLQQDAARLVLQAAPKDRFAIFSQLLGLSDLADFEAWCQSRDKDVASELKATDDDLARIEQRLASAEARLAAVRETARERPLVTDIIGRLRSSLETLGFAARVPEDREDAARIAAAAASLSREASQLDEDFAGIDEEARELGIQDAREVVVSSEAAQTRLDVEIGEASASAETLRTAVAAAEAEVQRLEEAQASLSRMAAAVLPHLTGPICPVCRQAVNEQELRHHLSSLEGALSAVEARRSAEQRRGELAQALATVTDLTRRRNEIADARIRRERWSGRVEQLNDRLAALRTAGPPLRPPAGSPEQSTRDWLRDLARSATVVAALAREVTAAFDASASAEEARVVKDQSTAAQQAESLRGRRSRLAQARNDASALVRAVRDARVEVVRQEFNRISPVAQDVYSRLDPHPTFQLIDLTPAVFRAAGTASATVRDPLLDIAADPMLVFSSAQANIAAVSFVIALNWVAASRAPVLMLDDPLQAMDDVNVLGFADLCRHLRGSRQLVVSTHEKRFAQLLERKLAPRRSGERTIALDFVGWDRSGPAIKPYDVPDQVDQLMSLLQRN